MTFTSPVFFLFLPIVFFSYWLLFSKDNRTQNILLLVASGYFYAIWNVYFLLLLAFSIGFNFILGQRIENTTSPGKKKIMLRLGVAVNVGILIFCKYFNFFIDQLSDRFSSLGAHWDLWSLRIIIPVGVSFFTFHSLSYLLDIYYKRIAATKSIVEYGVFISFFPLLVAGPIERATHLLPQLSKKRTFNYSLAVAGCRLMLWGLFKKVVIADSIAPTANHIFNYYAQLNSISLILGVIVFSIQIYCDFSGYSDIARGTARLFGIEVFKNFNFPYFSKNIIEYWSRWHISLSSWLNDYVFTPLALEFRDLNRHGIFLALVITFFISGCWHGAGGHFIVWGAIQALFYIPFIYSGNRPKVMLTTKSSSLSGKDIWRVLATYSCVCLADIFFRAESTAIALEYLKKIVTGIIFHPGQLLQRPTGSVAIIYITVFLTLDYIVMRNWAVRILSNRILRLAAYVVMGLVVISHLNFFNETGTFDFIYFQF